MVMAATNKPAPTLYQGVDKASTGYKLLSSMGWKEGQGLGASKQGITEHVKVKKKHDALGVGAAEQASRLRNWTVGMVNFDMILSKLKEVKATSPAPAAAADDPEGRTSDSEQEQAAANNKAAPANKAARENGKAAASSSSSESASEANASSSDSGAEKAPKPGARVRVATHIGRYQKRERAKMVKGYSASDLAAILGGTGTNDSTPTLPLVQAVHRSASSASSSGYASDDEAEEEVACPGPSSLAPKPAETMGMHHNKHAGAPAKAAQGTKPAAAPQTPEANAWWSSIFIRAGRVGSSQQQRQARTLQPPAANGNGQANIQVHGFKEQDQENLYEQVQNAAASGRQGLGRADAPRKVAGARWSGTKTKLGSDDEDDDDVNDGNDAADMATDDASKEDTQTVVVFASKSQQQQGATHKVVVPLATGSAGPKPSGPAVPEPSSVEPSTGLSKKRKATSSEPQHEVATGSVSKKAKKQAKEPASEVPLPTTLPSGDAFTKAAKVNWRKVAKQLLEQAPKRRMKLAKLQKQALGAVGLVADGTAANKLLCKLRSRPEKFEVGSKFVKLLC